MRTLNHVWRNSQGVSSTKDHQKQQCHSVGVFGSTSNFLCTGVSAQTQESCHVVSWSYLHCLPLTQISPDILFCLWGFRMSHIPSGWWFEPLGRIWKSIGMMKFPIYGKIKCMFQMDSIVPNLFRWVASCPASSSAVASTCSPQRCHGSAWRVSHGEKMPRKTWFHVPVMQHFLGRYVSNKRNYNDDASTSHGFTDRKCFFAYWATSKPALSESFLLFSCASVSKVSITHNLYSTAYCHYLVQWLWSTR